MDTRWIQDFVTLAEVRHFTRAADLRNVSQAAFSRRIQALEQWVGASLIDRTIYPLRLTAEGERFRAVATGLLEQIAEVRSDLAGQPSRNHVRLALPYALARTRLPRWWRQWVPGSDISCTVEVGHVHDTVAALTAGTVDLLIAYQHMAHPIDLDERQFERCLLGVERVRPYASAAWLAEHPGHWPGTPERPLPLLMYTPSVYFSRVVATALESAGQALHGTRVLESAMTDVLAELAVQGHGVAWLPDSALAGAALQDLVALGHGAWDADVSLVAHRSRAQTRRAVGQIWDQISATRPDGQSAWLSR